VQTSDITINAVVGAAANWIPSRIDKTIHVPALFVQDHVISFSGRGKKAGVSKVPYVPYYNIGILSPTP
jgi:hypothetical protein